MTDGHFEGPVSPDIDPSGPWPRARHGYTSDGYGNTVRDDTRADTRTNEQIVVDVLDRKSWHTNGSGDANAERAERIVAAMAAADRLVTPERDARILTEYEARRKAEPMHVIQIAGEPADEWMREHDAKVLRDAADAAGKFIPLVYVDGETAVRQWLLARAERIEKGETNG